MCKYLIIGPKEYLEQNEKHHLRVRRGVTQRKRDYHVITGIFKDNLPSVLTYTLAFPLSRLNFSYVVMPDFGAELSVPGTATLVWPNLLQNVEGNLIEFPTTTIGNSHVRDL